MYTPEEVLTNPQSEALQKELEQWNVEVLDEDHAVLTPKPE